jgi:UDP-N-acetylglucosamine 2-epimerase (non-hydrolysing)
MIHVMHVVGARPNFMKVAPVHAALARRDGVRQSIVHTGQHYDEKMSDVFFRELGLPAPDVNLEVGSGSHAQQTAQIISRFEGAVLADRPDLVLVYGDVNSTMAAALVCAKLLIKVGHVEAGLRSFDGTMPEEVNRIVTDRLSDVLFTPSSDGNVNLQREGVSADRIHLVGNVMIDTLVRLLPEAEMRAAQPPLDAWQGRRYTLVTLHRPSNVDEPESLRAILEALGELAREIDVLFPVHPRTHQRIQQMGITLDERISLIEPLSYLEFLAAQRGAALVVTDSGGVQEETTFLGVPCLTLRENTERPVTVTIGTNLLVGRDLARMLDESRRILRGEGKKGAVPPLWDGRAAERIADVVCALDQNQENLTDERNSYAATN